MGDYEQSTTVERDAEALYAYLADVDNLPAYFAAMTSARLTGGSGGDGPAGSEEVETTATVDGQEVGGTAWLHRDDAAKRLQWGSQGPNDYRGDLDVTPDPTTSGSSVVAVRLHTTRVGDDDAEIDAGLKETLASIKRLCER